MASNLYPNPALRQDNLNRQGMLVPEDPTTPEVMDSVFFGIENNTYKILTSNRKGELLDEEAGNDLLTPEVAFEEFGVETQEAISRANAERIRDNMDEVARTNYNISTLDRTSLNQARVFINAMGGAVLTDPVTVALSFVTGGAGLVAGKAAMKSGIVSNAVRAATSTGLGRIGLGVGAGVATGVTEGIIESEILQDQAPKAGLQFDDDDYWNNVKANTFFGGLFGGAAAAGRELGRLRNQKSIESTFKASTEADSNKKTYLPPYRQERYKDVRGRGTYYTTHFTNDTNVNFNTQTPVSRSDFGEGFQFSSSREWAFSDKGYNSALKEQVFEVELGQDGISLFDAEAALTKETRQELVDSLVDDISDLPPEIVRALKEDEIPVKDIADLLTAFDRKADKNTIQKLNKVIKDLGHKGYSFEEGIRGVDGEVKRGIHLFEMPESVAARHLNQEQDFNAQGRLDEPTRTRQDQETQTALDFYGDPKNELHHVESIDADLEVELPSLPDEAFEIDEFRAMADDLEADRIEISEDFGPEESVTGLSEPEIEARRVQKKKLESLEDTITADEAREIAKATDFCTRN